jgi:hypothetical protein
MKPAAAGQPSQAAIRQTPKENPMKICNAIVTSSMRLRTLAGIAVLVTAAAMAPLASPAVTRGDAEAVLNAYTTGGRTIESLGPDRSNGAPAAGFVAQIRPFAGTPWDGAHVCADDWHVIVAAWFDGNEIGGPQSTVPEIKARIAAVTMSYTLNGAPLETTRTATKRFLQSSFQDVFGFQQGTVVKLAPGTYTLGVHFSDPLSGEFDNGITFYVDEAACA